MDGKRRLRLALIVIVEGILVCDSSKVRASKDVAEMLKDLDAFVNYPWGRRSFERTIETVNVGMFKRTPDVLCKKLMGSHTATHGFTLAFQLFFLKAIPLLETHLPETDAELTFTDRCVKHLTKLMSYHNANIIQIESDKNVSLHVPHIYYMSIVTSVTSSHYISCRQLRVHFLLPSDVPIDPLSCSWVDEVDDERVGYMLKKIEDGHVFTPDVWPGGMAQLPLIPASMGVNRTTADLPKTKVSVPIRRNKKRGKGKAPAFVQEEDPVDDYPIEDPVDDYPIDSLTVQQLLREVDRRNKEHTAKMKRLWDVERSLLQDEIYDRVIRSLKSKGVCPNSPPMSHPDTAQKFNQSSWENYGLNIANVVNSINKSFKDGCMDNVHPKDNADTADSSSDEHDNEDCRSRSSGREEGDVGLGSASEEDVERMVICTQPDTATNPPHKLSQSGW
ncbi:PREDICTED: uncharacterized protein LOC104731997 isoform X2 [Camelina sativa]|uniref:Uncharacterized protein LOC104731997 isoform X2 n=1 Tax=Camelina sativa TaxID=90675 RepID=A0ABM0V2H8_CAMSA|nr:PREDICTED: uncharacterized protein LOC104731997 isoform X2 [Camelina sativa]